MSLSILGLMQVAALRSYLIIRFSLICVKLGSLASLMMLPMWKKPETVMHNLEFFFSLILFADLYIIDPYSILERNSALYVNRSSCLPAPHLLWDIHLIILNLILHSLSLYNICFLNLMSKNIPNILEVSTKLFLLWVWVCYLQYVWTILYIHFSAMKIWSLI